MFPDNQVINIDIKKLREALSLPIILQVRKLHRDSMPFLEYTSIDLDDLKSEKFNKQFSLIGVENISIVLFTNNKLTIQLVKKIIYIENMTDKDYEDYHKLYPNVTKI